MNNDIKQAINTFLSGGIVIFPTDTVFGIGCRMDNPQAVEKVFAIRNRPQEKAVLVLVDSVAMAQKYLQPIPRDVHEKLMDVYWPGGLTIILPCLIDKVPPLVRGGGSTLAVRQTIILYC